ncbi:MAG: malonyl-CoA decarboxylase, partial [Desulfofustis sp.]|nr:malonyl-CoA decarboxylase [Desulfofustis sp.]
NENGRRRFLELLAVSYDVDNDALEAAIGERRRTAEDAVARQQATARLRDVLESPRIKLLRQFNGLKGGVKFLVDLRAELMRWARENEELRALDRDVCRLLASWFDVGFLELQRITWDTSAALLEKLIHYEAVHEITSWQDLKSRLEEDRCCYAYFHPHMPHEPLIFVEVALVNGISTSIHQLLDVRGPAGDPTEVDTAIFYSISNCQAGLAGVSFGNFLIKRVVADLTAKLPNVKTFSTLSPIPGFVAWLQQQEDVPELVEVDAEAVACLRAEPIDVECFARLLSPEQNAGGSNGKRSLHLQQALLQLCARYLLTAKRGRQAWDRVAHFHLTNGAQIKQINWAANRSARGIEESAGMMVNYLYDLSSIEKHHEAYSSQGHISAAAAVKKLVK